MLLRTKKIACTADFQITHGNLKARAKLRKFTNGLQAFFRRLAQHFIPLIHQIRIRNAIASAHASAQLIQLRKPHAVGILNDDGIRIGNIHPRFDNCCADQNINLAADEIAHNAFQLSLRHLPMRIGHICIRHKPLHPEGLLADGFYTIIEIINLSAAADFPVNSLTNKFGVIFHHIGLNGMPFLRRLLQKAHIANPRKAHVKRSGDRGCGKRQHIHVFSECLQLFLMRHAEALLLIHDNQPQILELDILGENPMCPNQNFGIALFDILQALLLLLRRTETGEQLDMHRIARHSLGKGIVMLLCQNGSRD